jgi:hypothetical protein
MIGTEKYERLLSTLHSLERSRSSRVSRLPRDVRRMVGDFLAWGEETVTFPDRIHQRHRCEYEHSATMNSNSRGVFTKFTIVEPEHVCRSDVSLRLTVPHFKGILHGTLCAAIDEGRFLQAEFDEGKLKTCWGPPRSVVERSQGGIYIAELLGAQGGPLFQVRADGETITLEKGSRCWRGEFEFERAFSFECDSARIYKESWSCPIENGGNPGDRCRARMWEMTTRWGEPLYESLHIKGRQYLSERFFKRGLPWKETERRGGTFTSWTLWSNGRVRDMLSYENEERDRAIQREWRRNGSLRRMVRYLGDGRREVTRYDVGGYPAYVVTLNRKGRRDGLLRCCGVQGEDEEAEMWRNGRPAHHRSGR